MKQVILILGVFISISSLAFAGYDDAIEGGRDWLEKNQDKVNHGWEPFYSSYTNGRAARAFLAYEKAISEPDILLIENYDSVRERLLQLQATNGSWDNDVLYTSKALCALMEDPCQSPDANEIKRAVKWLKDRQDSNDGSWDHSYVNNSAAIIALISVEKPNVSEAVAKGVEWLLENQVKGNDPRWWGVPPDADSTLNCHEAEPVIALSKMADLADSQEVKDAIQGAIENAIAWLDENVDNISVTYRKLAALRAFTYARTEEQISDANNWVTAAQNSNWGWNFWKKDVEPSHSVATSNAIIALAEAYPSGNKNKVQMENGLKWIESEISVDGTVEGDYEVVDTTAWAISGLGINGKSEPNVMNAMTALAQSQDKIQGSWNWASLVGVLSDGNSTILAGLSLWAFSNSGVEYKNYTAYNECVNNANTFLHLSGNGVVGWGHSPGSPKAMDPTLYALIGKYSIGGQPKD